MDKFQNKYRISSARAQWWDYGWNGAYFITICTQNRQHFFGEIVRGRDTINRVSTSPDGEMAYQYWQEIPGRFPFAELGDFIVMPNHVHGIIIIDKPPVPVETQFIASDPDTRFIASNPETRSIASEHIASDPIASDHIASDHIASDHITSDHITSDHITSDQSIASDPNHAESIAPDPEAQFIASDSETRSIASLQQNPQKQPGGFAGDKNPMLNDNISKIVRWYKGRCSFEIRKINAEFKWQSRFHDHIIRNDKEYQRISDYIINNPDTWKDDKFNNGL